MNSPYPDPKKVSANTAKIMKATNKIIKGGFFKREEAIKLLVETYVNDLSSESRMSRKILKSLIEFSAYEILDADITIERGNYFKLLFDTIYPDHYEISRECGKRKDKLACEQGQYPYIPLNMTAFDRLMSYIESHYGKRNFFFDVGCGVGDKALLAYKTKLFKKVGGIEYDITSFDVADCKTSRIINHIKRTVDPHCDVSPSTFIKGDAFTHDYSPYDTIYLYCPIITNNGMSKLLSHVYNTMDDDAIIFFKNAALDIREWERKHKLKSTWVEDADCNIITKR